MTCLKSPGNLGACCLRGKDGKPGGKHLVPQGLTCPPAGPPHRSTAWSLRPWVWDIPGVSHTVRVHMCAHTDDTEDTQHAHTCPVLMYMYMHTQCTHMVLTCTQNPCTHTLLVHTHRTSMHTLSPHAHTALMHTQYPCAHSTHQAHTVDVHNPESGVCSLEP